jgi:hypothetical protein
MRVLVVPTLIGILLGWTLPVWAASVVQSEGRATVEAIPNYVEFWYHVIRDGATVEEAAGKVAELETRLRTIVRERELSPTEIQMSSLAVPDVRYSEVQRTIRMRFNAISFTDPEKGAARFATFCDVLLDIERTESWILEGPVFGVNNRVEFEQLAVANATKEAFPAAEGIAQALRGNLTSVDSVVILALEWNRVPDAYFPLPNIRTVACSAHVQVTYLFEPGPTPQGR